MAIDETGDIQGVAQLGVYMYVILIMDNAAFFAHQYQILGLPICFQHRLVQPPPIVLYRLYYTIL